MHNCKTLRTIIGLAVIGIAIFSFNHFEFGNKAIPIWTQKKEEATNDVQITQVGILSEACNKMVLEISYHNVKNENNASYKVKAGHLAANNDYSGLRGDSSIALSDGEGAVEFKRWITPENTSSETNKFWVQIDTVKNDGTETFVDYVEIERNKSWNNLCK